MSTEKTESAVIVPEIFLSESDEIADGYVLIVEGTELNVSKGAMAIQSKPLRKTMFSTDFRNAEEGRVDLKGKKLCDVVPLLCWVFEREDPAAANKTYGNLGKGRRIANEDLPGLIALADEWEMKQLLKDCQDVYKEFIAKGFENKDTAVLALKTMAVLDRISLIEKFGDTPDFLINAGIDIVDINAVGVSGPLHTLLVKKYVSKGYFKNKDEALKALAVLESVEMTEEELGMITSYLIIAGIDIDDIDAVGVTNPIRNLLFKNFIYYGEFWNSG